MIRSTMLDIFSEVWPTILISMVIVVTLRLYYLIKNKQKIILYKELLSLIFIIYILCLFYIVTFQDVSWSTSNFIPFHEMFRYEFGSGLFIKNVLGNVLLFAPYGFFMAYYIKLEKIAPAVLLSLLVSVTIETTQLLIGRVFDIDDIILNVLGGIIGFYIFKLLNSLKNHLPSILKKALIYDIIIVISLILIIMYLIGIVKIGV